MFFSNSPIILFFWRRRGGESAFARVITPCYRRQEGFFLPLSISAKIYYKIQKSRQFSDFFKIAPPPADASNFRPRADTAKEKRPQISEGVFYSILGVERCIMRPFPF
jgi:hypothetical protein